MWTLRCYTTQWHKHKQQWREERDAHFLSWKYILSLGQLKMRILRFFVHSVPAAKYYHASKTQTKIWINIWSHSTARLRLQSKSHQVVLSRELRAKPRPRLLQGVPTTQTTKLDFGAKQVSGGELKKLVRRYVVEEILPLNTVDSPLFGAIINKISATINAVFGVIVKNALPINVKPVVIFMLRWRGVLSAAAECNL